MRETRRAFHRGLGLGDANRRDSVRFNYGASVACSSDRCATVPRGAASHRTRRRVADLCALALGFLLPLGALGCSSTTTGETGSDTAETTTTSNVQPLDEANLTPTDATDTPTDDLDSTERVEQNQAAEADTPEADYESQETPPEDGDAEDSESTEDSELMVDPESTEDLHSPDTQANGLDSSLWSDWGPHNLHGSEARYDHGGGRIMTPWLMPWKDGFLQVGHRMIDDRWDRSRFFFRLSADGLEWTDFDVLDVPREHVSQSVIIDGDDNQIKLVPVADVASNGEHLVVAVHWQPHNTAWSSHDSDDEIEGPTPHSKTYVSVTNDLTDWDTREILTSPPDFLHQSLQVDLSIHDLHVSQGGWLLPAETSAYMDLPSLLPAEIRRSASRIRPTAYDGEGITFEWTANEDQEAADAEPHTRRFSWEELGTTQDLYETYGIDGLLRNDAIGPEALYTHQTFGSVWAAAWGEDPVRAELPRVGGRCCSIAATSDGYIGLSDPSEPGYRPWWFGPASLVFSSDGLSWETIGPIAGEEFWLDKIGSVNDGVIIYGWRHPESRSETRLYLLGESDGSQFYEIDLAEGTSLIECLMMQGKAPVYWTGTAVNGDTLLAFGRSGLIERYETPAPSGAVVRPNTCAVDTEFRGSVPPGGGN